jgi:hypothetical protein
MEISRKSIELWGGEGFPKDVPKSETGKLYKQRKSRSACRKRK